MTKRNLSVELRPRRLSEMVGQDNLVRDIRNAFKTGTIPLAVLLTGGYGSGKTTIAHILALVFNCEHQKQFGEPCVDCLNNEEIFSIIEHNCALISTKDEMQDLLRTVRSYPTYGKYRVIILDEAQQLSAAAQQALLKEFEKKEDVNIYIIGTTNPAKINQGLKDRSIPFSIPELTPQGVTAVVQNTMKLAAEQFQIPSQDLSPLVKCLHSAFITSSRNVVMATEMYLSGMSPEKAITIKDAGEIDFFALYKAVGWGKWDLARAMLAKAKPVEAAAIKMRLSAFFRNDLLNAPPGVRAELLAKFISALGEASAVETGLELSMVCGVIYQICQIVNENKKPARVTPIREVA